jgi:hypothetical protein
MLYKSREWYKIQWKDCERKIKIQENRKMEIVEGLIERKMKSELIIEMRDLE